LLTTSQALPQTECPRGRLVPLAPEASSYGVLFPPLLIIPQALSQTKFHGGRSSPLGPAESSYGFYAPFPVDVSHTVICCLLPCQSTISTSVLDCLQVPYVCLPSSGGYRGVSPWRLSSLPPPCSSLMKSPCGQFWPMAVDHFSPSGASSSGGRSPPSLSALRAQSQTEWPGGSGAPLVS
jgi:hypothetical protein